MSPFILNESEYTLMYSNKNKVVLISIQLIHKPNIMYIDLINQSSFTNRNRTRFLLYSRARNCSRTSPLVNVRVLTLEVQTAVINIYCSRSSQTNKTDDTCYAIENVWVDIKTNYSFDCTLHLDGGDVVFEMLQKLELY